MNCDNLIKEMKDFTLNANNIPIELILAFSEFRSQLNKLNYIQKPNFMENDIPIEMNNWEEWKYSGLNAIDYITSGFYKETSDHPFWE